MTWQSTAVAFFTASLIRPPALAVLAWLALRLFRIRRPETQHAVWTTVLLCFILIPIATVITPRLNLRILPPHPATFHPAAIQATHDTAPPATPSAPVLATPATPPATLPSAGTLLLILYAAGLAALLAYRVTGWLLFRRVFSRSLAIHRRVRQSTDLAAPVAAGLLRPCVMLPADWRAWPGAQKRAVLAHEFAHLRRRDPLVSSLARAAQSIFWFHPLSWFLARRLSGLAELSCDLAALRRSLSPADYSRILLAFAETVSRSSTRISLPGLAMAAPSNIGRRIDAILDLSSRSPIPARQLAVPAARIFLAAAPLACLAATLTLAEQEPPRPSAGPIPKFDVVSVKPCTSSAASPAGAAAGGRGGGGGGSISPGRISLECRTVDALIRDAYLRFPEGKPIPTDPLNGMRRMRLSYRQLSQEIKGSPGWLASDRFTIDATTEGAPGRQMMIGPMMQSLLADRFGLQIHTESRDTPVFALTVAKGGPKLQPADGDCFKFGSEPPPRPVPGQVRQLICGAAFHSATGEERIKSATMADLTEDLSRLLEFDVIDKTGLTGLFDISMQLTRADGSHGLTFGDPKIQADIEAARAAATDPPGTSVFAAIEKLGLRLDRTRSPTEFLVIDQVAKPAAN